jgi:hypothetical protein
MTLRNRHDRTNDHDGDLDSSDVDVDEIRLPDYPARTPLHDVLTGLLARLGGTPSTRSFTIQAVVKRTMQWQIIAGSFSLDAVIGTPSALVYPGRFTLDAVKRKTQTGSKTLNAVIKRNQTGSFTIDAKVV